MNSIQSPDPSSAAITDSPWFWLLAFSLFGLVAIALIGPKYSKRQGRLELQYQAHQEVDRRLVEGEEPARPMGQEGSAPPPPPGELIVTLWPVTMVLTAVAVVAWIGLVRSRRRASGTNPRPASQASD